MIRITLLNSLLLLALANNCFGQNDTEVNKRYFNNFEDSVQGAEWINTNTIAGEMSDNYVSVIGASQPYSCGLEIEIPPELKKKNFRVNVKANFLSSDIKPEYRLVISISKGDSEIYWAGFPLPDSSAAPDHYKNIAASTLIPQNIPPDSKVKIFFWHTGGSSQAKIDDLEILFTRIKFPSFLPQP